MVESRLKELYSFFLKSQGVSTDTRSLEQGQIYFALKGPNFDGNEYANQAIEKGACLAVIDSTTIQDLSSSQYFLVENCLVALQQLATFHRQQLNAKIIAITGSNGKTTTKELLTAVLSTKFNVTSTIGNLNNHIGVPITLLELKSETEFGIIEMGANHIGEIAELCKIAQPEYGLVTNIGQAHLEGFGSLEGVKQGKGELYECLKSMNGTIFLNTDEQYLSEMVGDYDQVCRYSSDNNFDSEIRISIKKGAKGLDLRIEEYPSVIESSISLFGSYNAPNILAALNIGYFFNVQLLDMLETLKMFKPNNRRSQIIDSEKNIVILDAYNANPSSMIEAVDAFCEHDGENKAMILGDMFELGEDSIKLHQNIIDYVNSKYKGDLFLVGSNFDQAQAENALVFRNRSELETHLNKHPMVDRTILIKGSRGMSLEELLPMF